MQIPSVFRRGVTFSELSVGLAFVVVILVMMFALNDATASRMTGSFSR